MTDRTTALDELTEEVRALRDLFQRRLLDDKARNRLYDQLSADVEFAREGLARGYLKPLLHELLRIVDRLPAASSDAGGADVRAELEEILARRGVRRIPDTSAFDPRLHEAVEARPDDVAPRNALLAVLREGYLLETQLLRPALVVVSTGPTEAAAAS